MAKVARAEWDDAVRAARRGLDGVPLVRHGALTVLGRVRARRGEPAARLLREAWELAVELRELQRTGPTAVAAAAWLAGDHAAVWPSPARCTRTPAAWATLRSRPSWATG